MSMIHKNIKQLVKYGLKNHLLEKEDEIFTINQLLELFQLDEMEDVEVQEAELEDILKEMLDYAVTNGLIEDDITNRDLFDTKIMSKLLPRPSEVIRTFRKLYKEESPKAATDYYYKFSQDTDYIRRYRVCKDQKWTTETEYGDMDITINLSKPEKDPKAIAAAKLAKQAGYPKCLLCVENEGYAGRVNHPARQNHRIIPIEINNSTWGFQYSPYVYYNEHCIVFNSKHIPMKIEHDTFCKLFDFVKQFPHYIVGSNADLPIVGGSILSHDHFQGGNYEFAMAKAPVETEFVVEGFEDVKAGIVKWPMSVIRLSGKDTDRIIALSDKILDTWREYTDEDAFIYAYTDDEPHNTITPIARKRGENFEMDLVLRNKLTYFRLINRRITVRRRIVLGNNETFNRRPYVTEHFVKRGKVTFSSIQEVRKARFKLGRVFRHKRLVFFFRHDAFQVLMYGLTMQENPSTIRFIIIRLFIARRITRTTHNQRKCKDFEFFVLCLQRLQKR